jgi:aspartate racemase
MESAIFGEVKGVEFVRAQPQEEDFIHKTYVEVAQAAKASDAQRKDMLALAHTIVIRDRVDAIILAGTDLALVFNSSNTDFPCIDCAALHLEAVLRVLIGGERLSGR